MSFAAPAITDIPIRHITTIDIRCLSKALQVATNEGQQRKIPIYGKDAEQARALVLELIQTA